MRDPSVQPILKWAGGKRQLLETIEPLLPKEIDFYCEPFLGGGALLFHLQPHAAIINDANKNLMLVYRAVRDNVEALVEELSGFENTAECFYAVRAWDRDEERYAAIPDEKKAARIIFLNKTCFNGLYRVNSSGKFNVSFGKYKAPKILEAQALRAVSAYLRENSVAICSEDYSNVLDLVPEGGFVYLDPPYDPISDTAGFTGYTTRGFSREEQLRLKECCDALSERGVKFMLSNSSTPYIKSLFSDYEVIVVKARRSINSVGSKRGAVDEVIVRNYAA